MHVTNPLRDMLKKDAQSPPNEKQLQMIEALKSLVVETPRLAVPNEAAAIAAARAWMNGDPPAGVP